MRHEITAQRQRDKGGAGPKDEIQALLAEIIVRQRQFSFPRIRPFTLILFREIDFSRKTLL
jgi:hypothetical protein